MLVGALASAGAEKSAIADAIHALDAGAEVSFELVKRRGIGALKPENTGTCTTSWR